MNGTAIESLARLAVFAGLSGPQLQAVAHSYDEDVYAEGQRILRKGLTGSGLYVILDGTAAIELDGREIAQLGRGEFFGEVSSLLGEAPTADVVAVTPLRCLVVPGPDLERFLLTNPPVAVNMLKAEALRLASVLEWRG
ncbi:MAG: cyclic nucleotide-binding domain-containing protein [Actinomycetota bacterium]|nr:cyclic nucleotide-binding domain-containing protein [Actinomycetota bacterium]